MKRTILITGATDGIGRETALRLLKKGHRVILHGRNSQKLAELEKEAKKISEDFSSYQADLASLRETAAMAEKILAEEKSLDTLLANAGVFMNQKQLTQDGIETTFAVNHLAHLLLALKLSDLLKSNADPRAIFVSSIAHRNGQILIPDIANPGAFGGYQSYADSKLANILCSKYLAKLWQGKISAYSLHPGVVSTKLLKSGFNMNGPDSLTDGSDTSVYLADQEIIEGISGDYFVKKRSSSASSALAKDMDLAEKLHDFSVSLIRDFSISI